MQVTRMPIDAEVTTPPGVRVEGDTTIVPVIEEVLVVEKRLILKEEFTSPARSGPRQWKYSSRSGSRERPANVRLVPKTQPDRKSTDGTR